MYITQDILLFLPFLYQMNMLSETGKVKVVMCLCYNCINCSQRCSPTKEDGLNQVARNFFSGKVQGEFTRK